MRKMYLGVGGIAILGCILATTLPPGHDHPAQPGHPRLLFSAAEVPDLRAKLGGANPQTDGLSNRFWTFALDAANKAMADTVGGYDANDTLAALAQVGPVDANRPLYARKAIDRCMAIINAYDPPYPNGPYGTDEHWPKQMYRKIALTYDCCLDQMTGPEREAFQLEMERICADLQQAVGGVDTNHQIGWAAGLGLCAMALEGDVPASRDIADEPVVRGSGDVDFVRYRTGIQITRAGLSPGAADFVLGQDFSTAAFGSGISYGIRWLGANRPGPGATYYVAYTFTPDFALWKEKSRAMALSYFDRSFADGCGMAGGQYSGWMLCWSVDLFEAFRRNMDYDFSTHPNVRDAVRWIPYELLQDISDYPGTAFSYLFEKRYRFSCRNDSSYADFWRSGRAIPYLAWCMTRFAGDPDGRDRVAQWLLRKGSPSFSLSGTSPWPNAITIGIGWREAIWATGPWPMAVEAMPQTMPRSRFFRGMNLAAFRSASWDAPNDEWSLFTLMGGPSAQDAEHDQCDKGSFTFSACGEDFAVDSSYGFEAPNANLTRAHNYLLIDGQDQTTTTDISAETRSWFTSGFCDGMHADLRKTYVGGSFRMHPPATWPVRRADRYALFLKHAGRAPYVVIADLVDKDGSPHDYDWHLHTAAGNVTSLPGTGGAPDNGFLTAGFQGKGTMRSFFSAAAQPVLSKEPWDPRAGLPTDFPNYSLIGAGVGIHDRLKVRVREVDPKILAILVPERVGEASPLAVTRGEGEGYASATVASGTTRDLIVQNRKGDLSGVVAGDIETDAALAIVRVDGSGSVVGWAFQNGTCLRHLGNVLWSASPATARGAACWDGVSLSVSGADEVTAFSAHAPGLSSFTWSDWTMYGTPSGSLLTWRGSARLLDVQPEGISAFSSGFPASAEAGWSVRPVRDAFCRAEGGAFCSPGLKESWISYTKRTMFHTIVYDPSWRIEQEAQFADDFQWPRTHFRDAVFRGSLRVEQYTDGADRLLRIGGRVSDLSYFDASKNKDNSDYVDQELVEARIRPGTGDLSLEKRVGTSDTTLAAGFVSALVPGSTHTYELSFSGDRVVFKLDGVERLAYQGADALPGKSGYFQWQVAQGMHVHFDDVRIDLPGRTVPGPSLLGISPSSGPQAGGTPVTIAGFDFLPGATVRFGTLMATDVSVSNANTISCVTPPQELIGLPAASGETVDVVVVNPDGQSASLPAAFAYVPPPQTVATSPAVGGTAGGTWVTLSGAGFRSGATVSFGGSAATSVTVVDTNTITCQTPSHASGAVDVAVTNPDGQSGTLSGGYTYEVIFTPIRRRR